MWTEENLWLGVFWFKLDIPWKYKESVDLNSRSEFSHRSLHRELLCSGRGLVWGWSLPRQCFWFSPSRTCQSHKVRSRWKILWKMNYFDKEIWTAILNNRFYLQIYFWPLFCPFITLYWNDWDILLWLTWFQYILWV